MALAEGALGANRMKLAGRIVKHVLERGLIVTGMAASVRRTHRKDILIVAYHNVVPDGSLVSGDRSLHISQSDFGRQLDLLQRTHDVVDLMTALNSVRSRTSIGRSRPCAAITFDDAYAGAMTAGIAELRSRQLPATVFAAPSFVGGQPFWWDMLAHPERGLDPSVRDEALSHLRGRHADVLKWAHHESMHVEEPLSNARCASPEAITAALHYEKVTIGSHTWSHPNLTRLSAAELKDELCSSFDWVAQFGDRAVPVVSYPYGQANSAVSTAAKAAGYSDGLLVDGGWTGVGHVDRFATPRLNVPAGVSEDGFVIRAAGLFVG